MSKKTKGVFDKAKIKAAAAGAAAGVLAVGGGAAVISQDDAPKQEVIEVQQEDTQSQVKKKYTIIVYVMGSDLESDGTDSEESSGDGAATADLQEMVQAMKRAGLDHTVNIVAEIGGSHAWMAPELAGIKHARLTIDSSGIHVKEKMPDLNMGESSTVTDFINYACKAYPAENYYMVLWNHGSGPTDGYGYDVLHDGDSLTLDELYQSIQQAQFQDFELIGFDACCMGNIETANVLHGFTDYVVASPACEDLDGWDYSWIEVLSGEAVSGREAGKKIVETYAEYYGSSDVDAERSVDNKSNVNMDTKADVGTSGKTAALSCYDMSQYGELLKYVQDFVKALFERADKEFYYGLSAARNQIAGYYSGERLNEAMELLDFAQLFGYLDSDLWEQSPIADCLDRFICCAAGNNDSLCGLGIYLPASRGTLLADDMYHYMNCRFDDNYIKFVYNYAKTLDQDLELNLEDIRARYDENSKSIQFQVDPELLEQIAAAYIMTAYPLDGENGYYLLSTDSDVVIDEEGIVTGILDNQYFTVAGQVLSLIEQYNSGVCTGYLSPILYNGKICLMTVEVSMEYQDGKIVGIVPYEEDKRAGKELYELTEGDTFCALHPIIKEDGEVLLRENLMDSMYQAEEEVVLQEYDCGLELQEIRFEDCRYGLMIKDKGLGVHYSDLYE